MRLVFVGGAAGVTGSCYYVEVNRLKMLVDCGLHQGLKADEANRRPFPFRPWELDCVFVTHAHMDHSGMLPRLAKEGFRGKIFSTPATFDLVKPMLFDSANIQESDAEWETKRALRAGKEPVHPLYSSEDVEAAIALFDTRDYGAVWRVGPGVRFRFLDAGHILGSATLEIWFQDSEREKKIVFSGDIGKKDNPIVRDPSSPEGAEFVIMETTYGSRDHKPIAESIEELAAAIKSAFKRGGNVYIPSFAVGRTQDILYILNNLSRQGRLYRSDVYLDSPLAEEVTRIYLDHPECFDEDARRFFTTRTTLESMRLHFVRSIEESMRLNRVRNCSIIIAGSGMCEGGRIRHHLKHNLWRQECSVIFVGYQAEGTLGREIVGGAKTVNVLGEEVAVKASIHTINGFSAHAGRSELLAWLASFNDSPRVFLVHGEKSSTRAFGELVKEKLGHECVIPNEMEEFTL